MVAPRYYPAIGGVEVHIRNLLSQLQKRGFQITLVTLSHQVNTPAHEQYGGVKIIRAPFGWGRCAPLMSIWLWRQLKVENKLLIHFHDVIPLMLWGIPSLLSYRNTPFFATFHGFERDPVPAAFILLRRIARKLVKGVICIGQFIIKIYKTPCTFTTIGAVEPASEDGHKRGGIIFVGRLEEDTGIRQYLEAIALLKSKYKTMPHVTICGDGILKQELQSFAKEHELPVEFTGMIKNPRDYIKSHRICLAGGFLSILEAMSTGTPVVAIATTPLKFAYYQSIIAEKGPLSIHSSPHNLAKRIHLILSSKEIEDTLSKESRKFAKKMTWDRVVDMYLKLWFRR